jgi:hypothetical protein
MGQIMAVNNLALGLRNRRPGRSAGATERINLCPNVATPKEEIESAVKELLPE